jgi:hypothetical protein
MSLPVAWCDGDGDGAHRRLGETRRDEAESFAEVRFTPAGGQVAANVGPRSGPGRLAGIAVYVPTDATLGLPERVSHPTTATAAHQWEQPRLCGPVQAPRTPSRAAGGRDLSRTAS